jgi:disulfide bond formation protein DsbB
MEQINNLVKQNAINFVFYISLIGTMGSLFLGRYFVPCELCWYQRVLLYPLTILTAVAMINKDKQGVAKYILPFSIPGFALALYHYLLQMKIIAVDVISCGNSGISCSTVDWNIGGFITIPLLSAMAFAAISVIMLWYYRVQAKANQT